jgi:TfoX/Sxy family transcriptional regulator of competence genes
MSSKQETVDLILKQMAAAGEVSARKMFGEYGIYCDGKMVASVCDDQLFVKPTVAGRAFIGRVTEASPYPGAKPSLLIEAKQYGDFKWLSELIRITAQELPLPQKKDNKKKK